MGGFWAVCTTDFVQGSLMLVALLAVPLLAFAFLGGDINAGLSATGVDSNTFLNVFASGSTGSLVNNTVYEEMNILRVRIHGLANSDERKYFEYPEYISRTDYIKELAAAPNGKKAQIINFNINYIDDRLAKNITKIYSKMLFEYCKNK